LKEFQAEHFQRNPASGSVLRKIGFTFKNTEIKKDKLTNSKEYFDEYVLFLDEFLKNIT
jgi:hypothetical protein